MFTQTTLRVWYGEHWPIPFGCKMRRIGWLDQKGRIWTEVPPGNTFDGGSLTPLLVQDDD